MSFQFDNNDNVPDFRAPAEPFRFPAPVVPSPPSTPTAAPKPRRNRNLAIGGLVLVLASLGGCGALIAARDQSAVSSVSAVTTVKASGTVAAPVPAPTTASAASGSPSSTAFKVAGPALDIKAIIAKVTPSVVAVEVGQTRNGVFQQFGAGSGFVISKDGLVLTNSHVVNLSDQSGRALTNVVINLKLGDGTSRPATVLGSAPNSDVALLQLADTRNLMPVTIGSSANLQVGDDVVAIGNALALGDTPSVTKGIVSAKNRTLDVDANVTLSGLIQTDAAINRGNSGGPLLNAAGEVVGINSAGIPDAQNIGFAIAIDTVTPLLDQLKLGQAPTAAATAYLGISSQPGINGITVTEVQTGTPAAAAGLQTGDVIAKFDGKAITAASELGAAIRARKPGDKVSFDVLRNGSTVSLSATLSSRPG